VFLNNEKNIQKQNCCYDEMTKFAIIFCGTFHHGLQKWLWFRDLLTVKISSILE